jgi:hypothetical protein
MAVPSLPDPGSRQFNPFPAEEAPLALIVAWHAACEPIDKLRANPFEPDGFDDDV